MKLYLIALLTLLSIATALGASIKDDGMIEYNTTMPDGSVLSHEVHQRAKFYSLNDKRDGSDSSAFKVTNLPSDVFSNATAASPNGTLPGPEELFQFTWTDTGFKWNDMNYCGWNMLWATQTDGPWVEDCLKLADIWAVMPGFWEVSDWGGDIDLNRLVRYQTCELHVASHDGRGDDVRIGNADVVIFSLQAAAMGWLAKKTRLALMYAVQAFPACYDLDTGGRAAVEFQVKRNPHVPVPTNTGSWPVLTATPTETNYGHPYPTSFYTSH
ncbi:hypothetical protein VPNG_01497 [Cytospora leucostoma]|uniref:Ecp2 effector protein-like domain-containing protein n=1 Tax=Cytospora leucostoma TaxID=1230097 RepID=A0A423XK32_9PEZI|nr:hypothetical protein VPNG_01497 [Cytospora leucostoma]